ncbi:MAG: type II toxin-antitoxin system RatA family toxin [Alphaproteobacteria bacterium]
MPVHAEQKYMPYSPEQLYALVADIEKYPQFLPWCAGARIRERREREVIADLVIGFKMIREKFTSRVTLTPPGTDERGGVAPRIDVAYIDGPMRHMSNKWVFNAQPDGGTLIDFHVEFEFRSKLLETLIGALFHEAVKRMVNAFEARAANLYGASAITPL